MNKMTPGQVGYLAGIFDGEGWFVTNKSAGPKACIAMTDFDIVERIHAYTRIGTLTFVKKTTKNQLQWTVGVHKDLEDLILTILPYLSQRRTERAQEVLADI